MTHLFDGADEDGGERVTPVNGRTGVIGAGRSAQVLGLAGWPTIDARTHKCVSCGKSTAKCACGPLLLVRLRLLPLARSGSVDGDARGKRVLRTLSRDSIVLQYYA